MRIKLDSLENPVTNITSLCLFEEQKKSVTVEKRERDMIVSQRICNQSKQTES